MVEFAAERGYEAVTVRGLGRLAGISTGTFYRHFPNVQHCFGHTYEWLMRSSLRRARAAQRRSEDWETGVRAALQSVLDDLARHPKAAQVVLIEAYAAGPAMHLRMRRAVAGFERLLATGPGSVAVTDPIRPGIAAAVMRVARTRLLSGQLARLGEDGGQLGDWIMSLSSGQMIGFGGSTGPVTLAADAGSRRPGDLRRAIGGPLGSENGRVHAAVAKLSAANGFSQLTIPRIRAEAGVSRRHLDDRFAGTEGCFLEAIEAIATQASIRAAHAAGRTDDWVAGVDAAIGCLCEEIACNPTLAHLVFVEILAPGRRGLLCREQLISLAATHLRAAPPPEQRPSQLLAEASSAAIWRIVRTDIAARRAGAAPRLAPLLREVSLAPTIGSRCLQS
jgi:AcrR family transcriptional regulator